jgi:hypothetical protein
MGSEVRIVVVLDADHGRRCSAAVVGSAGKLRKDLKTRRVGLLGDSNVAPHAVAEPLALR